MVLTWRYSLTADEQANSNAYSVKWFKFNSSSLVYTEIASYTVFLGTQAIGPANKEPRYVVGTPIASDSTTLLIIDVKKSDEGLYKIEYHLVSGKINESEVNLTVLGKFLSLNYDQHLMFVCCTSFHFLLQMIHLQILLVTLCVFVCPFNIIPFIKTS